MSTTTIDITEKTRVPLFAVLVSIPTLLGGMFWLTAIWQQGAEAARVNDRQDRQLNSQTEILNDIRDRVIRIEEHIRKR